jgi:hypothetical protein
MEDVVNPETRPPQSAASDAVARTETRGPRVHAWRAAIAFVVALIVAVGLVVKFPNLTGKPGYLALVALTPLLTGAAVALSRPVLGRGIPGAVSLILRFALVLSVALDLFFFVVVGLIQTKANDTAPVFITTTAASTIGTTATPAATAPPELTGQFDHRQGIDTASGKATLGTTAGGLSVLRLQDFAASHGPDLYVYLSTVALPTTAADVMNGLEVGPLKATSGNQNYSLPAGFVASRYKSVVIYCKSFSTIFGYATLA